MKISIIFHSVCGNTYLMAKAFQAHLQTRGHDVRLYRVNDPDWTEQANTPPGAQAHLREMLLLPAALPEMMLESDLVLMGSPTYFGNVSAEMKTFMDSVAKYWVKAQLAGKKLAAFTSTGNPQGGGDLCLQAIQTFGMFMGMLCVPVPTTLVPGENHPAFGLVQYSFGKYGEELDAKTAAAIAAFSAALV